MKTMRSISFFVTLLLTMFFISCEKKVIPTVITSEVSNITGTTATSGGTITDEGSGTVIERGICWSKGINPSITDISTIEGGGAGSFISNMINLEAATTYYVRAYATNIAGTGYGMAMSFSTLGAKASVSSEPATSVITTSAILNGTVNANYLATIVTFEYGTTTNYGQIITATQSPVTGNANKKVSADLSGLASGTAYHYRIKVENSLGIAYSEDISFITQILDTDGNIYNHVTIGTQVWMRENLKTTKLNDNTPIPFVASDLEWSTTLTPAYSWSNGDMANKTPYGALYNWYVANTGKLCPAGWHVPTDADWTTLTNTLGGESVAGGKMKEQGLAHWIYLNVGATNESGFTALPAGQRGGDGLYRFFNYDADWWSSTNVDADLIWYRAIRYTEVQIIRGKCYKYNGLSVRCVKD